MATSKQERSSQKKSATLSARIASQIGCPSVQDEIHEMIANGRKNTGVFGKEGLPTHSTLVLTGNSTQIPAFSTLINLTTTG